MNNRDVPRMISRTAAISELEPETVTSSPVRPLLRTSASLGQGKNLRCQHIPSPAPSLSYEFQQLQHPFTAAYRDYPLKCIQFPLSQEHRVSAPFSLPSQTPCMAGIIQCAGVAKEAEKVPIYGLSI